MIIYKTSAME